MNDNEIDILLSIPTIISNISRNAEILTNNSASAANIQSTEIQRNIPVVSSDNEITITHEQCDKLNKLLSSARNMSKNKILCDFIKTNKSIPIWLKSIIESSTISRDLEIMEKELNMIKQQYETDLNQVQFTFDVINERISWFKNNMFDDSYHTLIIMRAYALMTYYKHSKKMETALGKDQYKLFPNYVPSFTNPILEKHHIFLGGDDILFSPLYHLAYTISNYLVITKNDNIVKIETNNLIFRDLHCNKFYEQCDKFQIATKILNVFDMRFSIKSENVILLQPNYNNRSPEFREEIIKLFKFTQLYGSEVTAADILCSR